MKAMEAGNELLLQFLQGKDLRSTGNVEQLIPLIICQKDFDALFNFLNSSDRIIVMRAADAVEKISRAHPEFLKPHKEEILGFLDSARDQEFKRHLALMVSRLDLTAEEVGRVWSRLTTCATDRKESRIMRVNSLQALSELTYQNKDLKQHLELTFEEVSKENIPSINARIKRIRKKMLKAR